MTEPALSADDVFWLVQDADDRRAALDAAVRLHVAEHPRWCHDGQELSLEGLADACYRWLGQRTTMRAVQINLIAGTPRAEGAPVAAVTVTDDQILPITLSGTDSKDAEVAAPADTWTWSNDDPDGAVAVVTVSEDTQSAQAAAVAPGEINITATGQNTGLTGTLTITVVAGAAVAVELVAGTPEEETPAAPADAPPADAPAA